MNDKYALLHLKGPVFNGMADYYRRMYGSGVLAPKKLEILLRHHRNHVFDLSRGGYHLRAIYRLKRTVTWQLVMDDAQGRRDMLAGRRLEGMGY